MVLPSVILIVSLNILLFNVDAYLGNLLQRIEKDSIPTKNILYPTTLYKTDLMKPITWQTKTCFEKDINYKGEDINNGLMLLTASASECQTNCVVNTHCNYFTWADPNSFPDANYHNSCWLKKSLTTKVNQVGSVSGPKVCDETGCCNSLKFKSSGSLAEGMQKHILGYYNYYGEGVDGTTIYHQPSGGGGGEPELWLYFLENGFNTWFISNTKGYNGGYAWNHDGDSKCPEELAHEWQWYDGNTDSMILDETAMMDCETPPPITTPLPANCCNNLIFESSGSIAEGGQKHVLGSYDFSDNGQDGTQIYKQVGGSNYLYFMRSLQLWYIGDDPGVNMAYAMNKDNVPKCPEQLENVWQWWNWKEDEWTLDDLADIKCRSTMF